MSFADATRLVTISHGPRAEGIQTKKYHVLCVKDIVNLKLSTVERASLKQ